VLEDDRWAAEPIAGAYIIAVEGIHLSRGRVTRQRSDDRHTLQQRADARRL
jgi:hypothetical protein